jgi:putative hydrolase of the HAD superfamily
MIEAVYFDLDGTLYDDRQYIKAGLKEAALYLERETGKDFENEIKSIYFDEQKYEKTFDTLVNRNNLSKSHVPKMVSAYHNNVADLNLYNKALPVLKKLKQQYKLAIITDGRNGHEKICRLGIETIFDQVLVTPHHDFSKKELAPFEMVANTLSVEHGDTVYIGDNPAVEFYHPNQLGMTTIQIKAGMWGGNDVSESATPDIEVSEVARLLDIPIFNLLSN